MTIVSHLRDSLETGFITSQHVSLFDYQPQLVVNRKAEHKKILGMILYELRRCQSFHFSVAFLTTSGLAVLVNTLVELRDKGVKGRILVSQYQNFTQPEALSRLKMLEHIDLRIVTKGDFHAKGYIFEHVDYYSLIVGSSNLTANALTSNKEWNLRVTAMEDSKIVHDTLSEFEMEFDQATPVTKDYIEAYREIYEAQKRFSLSQAKTMEALLHKPIEANTMQLAALDNLQALRALGKDKALLISATGTGKTYLSAFDVNKVNPKRMLFLVHRENIANKARESFLKIMPQKSMGMFCGAQKERDKDYVFSTVQTFSRDENLLSFAPDHFDYIVIDETHRAGAATYQRILNYLSPKFLLGMTATPERTDGFDIFSQFDYNIAYEIRLHKALEEDMLCPFHYFGVTDVVIDQERIEDHAAFLQLTSEARVEHIIKRSKGYGCDDGYIRGLVFCNSNRVSGALSEAFNQRGYKTVALSGESSEAERECAIRRLESDDFSEKLDYIFTVDIFNEGVDIPRVNQIIMLRPTQSAIVFVQQLGRGLRKTEGKHYLTVIDFIGNYNSSYLVPIALYGDSSYNKDNLRKLISNESDAIPGASTINFERIARERIYTAIDQANMSRKKDLIVDYDLLKYKLGRIPMMMDFYEHGSRDAALYVEASRSYYNFVAEREKVAWVDPLGVKLLTFISRELANGKRIEEVVLMERLLTGDCSRRTFEDDMMYQYGYVPSQSTFKSVLHNINLRFITENSDKSESGEKAKKVSVGERHQLNLLDYDETNQVISFSGMMKTCLEYGKCDMTIASVGGAAFENHAGFGNRAGFRTFLKDVLAYAKVTYNADYRFDRFNDGFIDYKKYARKDVFRILNWAENPVAQNVGGYIVSPDKANCPIFVNYHKEDHISDTTKYEDEFINNRYFKWYSKSNRSLNSPDVQAILNHEEGNMRIPLFVKKNNDEGLEFYYMGDLRVVENSAVEERMPTADGKGASVVSMHMQLSKPVAHDLFTYLTEAVVSRSL